MFGFYTPTLRTTDLIPGQVRLLRSMLAGREDDVLRVILADDRSGTYVPRDGRVAIGRAEAGEDAEAQPGRPRREGRRADSAAPGVW